MTPNPDLLDLMIADRQRAIREAVSQTKHRTGFTVVRSVTGRALIAIGERISGCQRPEGSTMLVPGQDARLTALHSGSR
ncbi:MAG: hypothetical protein WBA63_15875 [Thermomicrobiales bacterium]